MANYYDATYLAWNSGPVIRGAGNSPEGGLDVTAIDDGHVLTDGSGPGNLPGDSKAYGVAATADGHLASILGLDWDASYFGTSPWVDSYKNYWTTTGVSTSNPITWARMWGVFNYSGNASISLGSSTWYTDAQKKLMHTAREYCTNTSGLSLPYGAGYELHYTFEYGSMPLSFGWTRPVTNKSTVGTSIIDPNSISWGLEPRFIGPDNLLIVDPPVNQLVTFELTVDSASSLSIYLLWHDPDDPGSWIPDATYGNIPDSKVKLTHPSLTTRPDYVNHRAWCNTTGDTIDHTGQAYLSSGGADSRSTFPTWRTDYPEPFGLFVVNNTTGARSYWGLGDPALPTSPDLPVVVNVRPTVRLRLSKGLSFDGGAP